MINLHPALQTKSLKSSQSFQPAFKSDYENNIEEEKRIDELQRQKRDFERTVNNKNTPKFIAGIFKIALVIAGTILGGATMKVGLETSFRKLSDFSKSKSVVDSTKKAKSFTGKVKNEIKTGYIVVKAEAIKASKKFKELKWVKNLDSKLKISETCNKIKANPKYIKFSESVKSAYNTTKTFIKDKTPTKEKVKTAFVNVTSGASAVAGGATAMASGSDSRSHSGYERHRSERSYRRDY